MTSIQPRKQRKARYDAPMHVKARQMHVHISKELRAKLGVSRRSIQLHKGDKVRLRRGDEAGKIGAVMEVDCRNRIVYAEGFVNKTAKGVEKLRALQPSNLEIMDGDFANKNRAAILARGKKTAVASVKNAPAKTQ
jgi:large subunit ribosomal protein L24